MIFFSIGLPGCFAEWCDAVIARLASQALGPVETIGTNKLDEVARCMIRRRASHVVACARQPEEAVRAALTEGDSRFVLALDEPRAALADMMNRHGYDLVTAARAVASSCATLLRFADCRGALVLRGENFRRDPVAAAAAIAAHFDLSGAQPAPAVEELRQAGIALLPSAIDAWWDALGDSGRALVSGALDAYEDHFATGILRPFRWGREFFFTGDPPNEPAMRGIDITGRIRCLLYGPFVALPPGAWTAHVVLGCSREVAGMSFMMEAFAGRQLSRTILQPDAEGMFETSLGFVIDAEAADHPFQLRIFNERAAFDGRLGIASVTALPQARARADLGSELVQILGLNVE